MRPVVHFFTQRERQKKKKEEERKKERRKGVYTIDNACFPFFPFSPSSLGKGMGQTLNVLRVEVRCGLVKCQHATVDAERLREGQADDQRGEDLQRKKKKREGKVIFIVFIYDSE